MDIQQVIEADNLRFRKQIDLAGIVLDRIGVKPESEIQICPFGDQHSGAFGEESVWEAVIMANNRLYVLYYNHGLMTLSIEDYIGRLENGRFKRVPDDLANLMREDKPGQLMVYDSLIIDPGIW